MEKAVARQKRPKKNDKEQLERFKEAARKLGVNESLEDFQVKFRKIVPPKSRNRDRDPPELRRCLRPIRDELLLQGLKNSIFVKRNHNVGSLFPFQVPKSKSLNLSGKSLASHSYQVRTHHAQRSALWSARNSWSSINLGFSP